MNVPPDAWLLAQMTALGASLLVFHAVNLYLALRARRLAWPWRLAALVPLLTPVVAWLDGRRFAPALWALNLSAYLVLHQLV